MRSRRPFVVVVMLFHQLLLHFPVGTESYECILFHNKIKVQVINRIPSGFEPIKLHCWSKDDDLGRHTLGTNQQFEFRFCVTPFSTVFECEITWPRYIVHLYAYDASLGFDSCGTDGSCIWEVAMSEITGGMYLMLDNRSEDKAGVGSRISMQMKRKPYPP